MFSQLYQRLAVDCFNTEENYKLCDYSQVNSEFIFYDYKLDL